MSSFSRFQEINQKRGIANQKTNSSFILNGYPSISITGASGEEIAASVVNRQEKDMAYIYTSLDQALDVGSTWSTKGLTWLISQEIVIIKDVHWHKYEAIKCNVELNGKWCYFLGPKKTHIDVVLKESFLLQSQQEPVLIMPEGSLSINDKIMIKNRGWLVQEEDSISTPGISYYSLSPTTLGKDTIQNNMEKEVYVEEYAPIQAESKIEDNVILIAPDEFYTIATQDGVFASDSKVDVSSITANEVIFTLPYGVPEAKVVVKQNNQEKEYVFKHKV